MTTNKFQHAGLDWIPHTPGDPMPCPPDTLVRVLYRDGTQWVDPLVAFDFYWGDNNHKKDIIGWHPMTPDTPPPDYGEPWALDPTDGFLNKVADKDGKTVAGLVATRRAIACVNALAGIPDPAAHLASLNTTLESAIELIRRVSTGPATPNDAWEWLKQHNLD